MNLDEAQRKKVTEWIAQGLKLSEIQNRLASELNVSMTYMDVRFLVDDLKLTPKDVDRPKPSQSALATSSAAPPSGAAGARAGTNQAGAAGQKAVGPAIGSGGVSVVVDEIARPGAVVSGRVTFSDGNVAAWHFDQAGRLGLVPEQPGYRPTPSDLQQFQMVLETELSRLGL